MSKLTLDEILEPWLDEIQSEYGYDGVEDQKLKPFVDYHNAKAQLSQLLGSIIGEDFPDTLVRKNDDGSKTVIRNPANVFVEAALQRAKEAGFKLEGET